MTHQRVHALIPAAGHSVRFGGTTLKQYAHLNGLPVMEHSISALARHKAVNALTVALAPDDGIYDQLIRPNWPHVTTLAGGDSRARTVMNGLEFILERDPECEWVLVHDAARPCLPFDALNRLLQEGIGSETGAILGIPVNDTLKLADADGRIQKTVDRTHYWSAQTPQLFPIRALAANLGSALDSGFSPTDEATAMEQAGLQPQLVMGSAENIKITGSEDLLLAEFILQRQLVQE